MAATPLALCITDLEVGGAERCLVELATRLDRQRFSPVVYSLAAPAATAAASLLPALEAAGVEVRCLGARSNWQLPWVVRQLKSHFVAQQPQLVQTFLFHANIVGRMAARRAGVNRVVCGIRVAERRSRWHLWIDRLTHRQVDRYVCVSRSVAQFAQTRGGLPPEKLTVIPNGVDAARFPAAKPVDLQEVGVAPGHRVVTFVGRLERQKGVMWLLETAAMWLAHLPDCDLLLVGKGPEQRRIENWRRASGMSGRVHLTGFRPDVPEILAASDLLVLPSAWEGMPNVVLEAMASRLPVVATDVEGVRELLGANADEQAVRYGDSQAFADRLVALLQDRQTAARLGAENRRRAQENFDLKQMVLAYQDLWESLLPG